MKDTGKVRLLFADDKELETFKKLITDKNKKEAFFEAYGIFPNAVMGYFETSSPTKEDMLAIIKCRSFTSKRGITREAFWCEHSQNFEANGLVHHEEVHTAYSCLMSTLSTKKYTIVIKRY